MALTNLSVCPIAIPRIVLFKTALSSPIRSRSEFERKHVCIEEKHLKIILLQFHLKVLPFCLTGQEKIFGLQKGCGRLSRHIAYCRKIYLSSNRGRYAIDVDVCLFPLSCMIVSDRLFAGFAHNVSVHLTHNYCQKYTLANDIRRILFVSFFDSR